MVKRQSRISESIMVDENSKEATLHSHHNGGSLRKERETYSQMLNWMQYRRRYGGSNRIRAWNGYDFNLDFSSRISICNGLCFYNDSYAKNYVLKRCCKSDGGWDTVSIAAMETAEISLALLI